MSPSQFSRDNKSNALINDDSTQYARAKLRKRKLIEEKSVFDALIDKVALLEARINKLENDH